LHCEKAMRCTRGYGYHYHTCRRHCNLTDSNPLENQQLGAGKAMLRSDRSRTPSIDVCSAPNKTCVVAIQPAVFGSLRVASIAQWSTTGNNASSPKRERIWICTPRSQMYTHAAERVIGWSPSNNGLNGAATWSLCLPIENGKKPAKTVPLSTRQDTGVLVRLVSSRGLPSKGEEGLAFEESKMVYYFLFLSHTPSISNYKSFQEFFGESKHIKFDQIYIVQ